MSRPVDSAFSRTFLSTDPFVCSVDMVMKEAPLGESSGVGEWGREYGLSVCVLGYDEVGFLL